METTNYQSKTTALLGYLTDRGYSEKYVSQFRHLPSRLHRLRHRAISYEKLPDGIRSLVDSYVAGCGRR